MTPEMTREGTEGAAADARYRLTSTFVEGEIEELPFSEDGRFDVVISNGVIDLIPDKEAGVLVRSTGFSGRAAGSSSPT